MWKAPAPDPTAAVVAQSSKTSLSMPPSRTTQTTEGNEMESKLGSEVVEKNNNSTRQSSPEINEPSLSATDQDRLIVSSPVDASCDREAETAQGKSIIPSLSATDQEETSASVDSSVVLQSPPPSIESKQNHHIVDTAEETPAAKSQLLTNKLIASGGDIRALLSSNQPLSSFWSQSADIGGKSAGQKIATKDDEEEGEDQEQEEERFVRLPRLRFTLSKEAASDGFPSSIALSRRWHPDHMQDIPRCTTNLSIRAAFDTKYDEYYVFRDWRPSQGS